VRVSVACVVDKGEHCVLLSGRQALEKEREPKDERLPGGEKMDTFPRLERGMVSCPEKAGRLVTSRKE